MGEIAEEVVGELAVVKAFQYFSMRTQGPWTMEGLDSLLLTLSVVSTSFVSVRSSSRKARSNSLSSLLYLLAAIRTLPIDGSLVISITPSQSARFVSIFIWVVTDVMISVVAVKLFNGFSFVIPSWRLSLRVMLSGP